MTKDMKLEDLGKFNLAEKIAIVKKRTIHFKNGLKFITKNGRITGIYPRFYKGDDLLKRYLGKPESEIVSINNEVLKLQQVQFLRTIITDKYVLKINRNDAVYDIDDEELFHFVVGQPANKALETLELMNMEWPIDDPNC